MIKQGLLFLLILDVFKHYRNITVDIYKKLNYLALNRITNM